MKVLILGASGMLGHQLCRTLNGRFDIWGTFREEMQENTYLEFLPPERKIGSVDVQDIVNLRRILETVKPEAVINGIGIVKQRDEAKQAVPSIHINALFPHQLADLGEEFGARVLQISTDCVFSGMRGNYTEIDAPDPVDLYGRTKLLGELNRPGSLTLRTSIIGWQLHTHSSLLGWFAAQRGRRIKGYRRAIYSGFSTAVLSNLIGDILETRKDLTGLYHVASASISKFDLLMRLREAMGWKDITIDPDDNFFCDRSLIATRFSSTTGWMPPDWDDMIAGLASEWPAYENWNRNS